MCLYHDILGEFRLVFHSNRAIIFAVVLSMCQSRDSILCLQSRSGNSYSFYSFQRCSSGSMHMIDHTDFLLPHLASVAHLLLRSIPQVHPSPHAIVALLLRFCVFSFGKYTLPIHLLLLQNAGSTQGLVANRLSLLTCDALMRGLFLPQLASFCAGVGLDGFSCTCHAMDHLGPSNS